MAMLQWTDQVQNGSLFSGTSGLLGARPVASTVDPGSYYLATDDNSGLGALYRSDGSDWEEQTGLPSWAGFFDTTNGVSYVLSSSGAWRTPAAGSFSATVDLGAAPTGYNPDAGGVGNLGWLGTIAARLLGVSTTTIGQVTVDTTATGVQIVEARATRKSVTIVNHGAIPVYLNTGNVSSTTGVKLPGVEGASIRIETQMLVKGIAESDSVVVGVIDNYF